MTHNMNSIFTDAEQLNRIGDHPFHIYRTDENASKNFIINDNLEMGFLRVYDNAEGILSFRQPVSDFDELTHSALVAEMTIGGLWQREIIFIHSIGCRYGYEYLLQPMIAQVVHFADFYKCYHSVWISANKKEKLSEYAKDILADFHKKGNAYICQIR